MTAVDIQPSSPARHLVPGAASLHVTDARVHLGGVEILHGVDLQVPTGRTLALLGPSGCGKTTLLRAVAGLQHLSTGRIHVGEDDITDVPAERRNVGMVFQDGALFPHMTVAANVGFGLDRAARRGPAVDEALEMVGLAGFGPRMPSTLSGGQQQRVALARALVAQPRVLLLDEPFSSLDAGLRGQIRADVARLLTELEITAVVVTHDQEEAFLLGHEVAVMIAGRIHQQAHPADIYTAPATREVAEFLGDANLVAGHASGTAAETMLGAVPLAADATGAMDVLVRPEHLRMTPGGPMTVRAVEYYGHDAITELTGPAGTLRVRTMSLPPYRAGDPVALTYDDPPTAAYRADWTS